MKLLLFSDLHSSWSAMGEIVREARRADVLVGAGDFCNMHRMLRDCLEVLKLANLPGVFVAGNNETTDALLEACCDWPNAHVLHGSSATIDGVTFYGIGGGIPVTPFGSWSYDFSEDEATGLLEACPKRCVLISHSPPKGAVDRDSSGRSLGSVAVRAAIERCDPVLAVCGHIHASAKQQALIGNTTVINAGPEGVFWKV
jgi:Icc-related predicted phosphoesterase